MSSSIGAADGPMLRFDGRAPYPHGDHDAVVTEHWVSVCDESGAHCLTLATFSEPYKEVDCAGTPWKGYGYMTPLGGFRIEPGMDVQVRAFLFPARFDQVLAGKTVRDWIVELAATELPTVDPGDTQDPDDSAVDSRVDSPVDSPVDSEPTKDTARTAERPPGVAKRLEGCGCAASSTGLPLAVVLLVLLVLRRG